MSPLPQIPERCPHFVRHDYGDGKPIWVFFPSGREYWSHDSNEPWPLEDRPEYPARLTKEQKQVVCGLALYKISKEAELLKKEDRRDCFARMLAWEKWIDE
jgi:hypothetical protein